ncbi:MAG: Putative transposase y4qJ [uncultured Chloroflexia bacterium]|uniref:Transposase y4qJ n=1 Tax=uncultured Chloroflexia bacterium TaxID=1672391 RepID=A0A6J4JP70_9CHLR|nr:MAG: Putative transposase y4qJ [uncultured Chloroflexia bacterium]
MSTLGEIFRRYGPAYREKMGDRLSTSERAAMAAIERCRTEALGGQVYTCPRCATVRYSYHSCRNRHCPTCQQGQAQIWLAKQQALRLPVPYFLVTFTLPAELRTIARQHQRRLYRLLFRSSATALQQLAADPRFLGGQIGMVGVLQTWTRDLRYHPHIHYLVPAGAFASTEGRWVHAKGRFLVHVKPLAKLFRGKMRAGLRQVKLEAAVPPAVWGKAWVVDCRPVGSGEAALKYLAPYIFRVALSNNRLERVVNDEVTFRYRAAESKKTKRCTLPAETFIRRFLQHVLPRAFVKVRYFGLFSPSKRAVLAQARALLDVREGAVRACSEQRVTIVAEEHEPIVSCPSCGAVMELTLVLLPASRSPP